MRPARNETADYWFGYIDQAPDGDIVTLPAKQHDAALAQLSAITDARSRHRYAPEKWSIRQLLAHISDCERLFAFRAFWFARGFNSELPSFDDTVATNCAASDRFAWSHHVEEFRAVRSATAALFAGLPDTAWGATGLASGSQFSVRALAWIMVDHAAHHLKVLAARYSA